MQDYQLTKTIRFKLNPIENALAEEVNAIDQNQQKATTEIAEFNRLTKNLANEVKGYLFIQSNSTQPNNKQLNSTQSNDKQSTLRLNHHLEIKKNWLKQHTKAHYYGWVTNENSEERSHKIAQVSYLNGELSSWRDRWNSLVEQLEELQQFPEENQARRAEFALLIAEFSKKNNFRFMRDFIKESQDKTDDTIKNKLLQLLVPLEESLTQCQQQYLPDQSKGLVIARASLNYYTINKKARDYAKEKHEIKNKLDAHCSLGEFEKMMITHWDKQKNTLVRQAKHQADNDETNNKISLLEQRLDDLQNINLDNAYSLIKQYKAEAKSEFNEAAYSTDGVDLERDKDKYPLFLKDILKIKDGLNKFNKFIKNTKEITQKNKQLSALDNNASTNKTAITKLKTEIKKIKQDRGSYFNSAINSKSKFSALVKQYKEIAMKRGKIIAEIKGIEREKIDSQLLNYWALIIQKNKQHQLLLIPKDQAAKAYQKLDKTQDANAAPSTTTSIHYFKSLTLRALKKLCFGTQGNTFAPTIKQELQSQYPKIQGAFSLADFQSEAEIVRFYQAVLTTNYVKKTLDIHDFDELDTLVKNKELKNLDDFERELEKVCYKKRVLAAKALSGYLRHECGAQFIKITSYDLAKDSNRKSKDKQHTQLWQQFWSQDNANSHYPMRLNPELKISWRKPKASRVIKYGTNSGNHNPKKNNRYLHPQFTLITTLTENANGKRLDLAFTSQDTLAEKIQEFNVEFNKKYAKDPYAMYCYGIDRGQAELATLALVSRFTKNKNEFKQPVAEFATFSVYRLKDDCLNYKQEYKCKGISKQRLAIKNLSYFIDNNADIFEQKQTASIDLTTAKMIKGKIVENGDILSYLQLKELSAKRRLYEYFSQAKIDLQQSPIVYFRDNEFLAHTNDNNSQAKIYYYRPDLEKIRPKDAIQKMLNDYLNALQTKNRERDILTIEKINHLRDAMAANMVGVIAHLYQQYPGIIALENLSKGQLAGHFMKSNENISRRLEWRLYNKFQNLGLVPPRLKDSILLRKDKNTDIKQFGLIHFIETENTSKNCPYCGEKNSKPKIEWDKDKLQHRLVDCTNTKCGFNTKTNRKGMESLNSPDNVASYNIAKSGFEYLLNPTQLQKTTTSKEAKHKTNRDQQSQSQHNRNKKPNPQHNHNKRQGEAKHQPFADLKEQMNKKD